MATKTKHKQRVQVPQTKPPIISDRQMGYLCISLILIAASLLMLMNLGNIYLWQDEAQTACISQTILTHGVPLGYDGKNYFSQEGGAEYGKNYIWRWHTWLPFYVLAGFFAIFGQSTFVARLPFALFGIATVIAGYYLALILWRTRRAAILTAVLLLLSVPFLILMRQCRYYSMTMFFTMTGLWAYLAMIEKRKHSGLAFALSSILLFQTQYLYYGALAATAVIHCAIFHRDRLKSVLLVSGVVFAINLPWIIWLAGANFGGSISYQDKNRLFILAGKFLDKHWHVAASFPPALHNACAKFLGALYMARIYFLEIKADIFPPLLLIIPVITATGKRIRDGKFPRRDPDMAQRLWLVFIFMIVTTLACVVMSPYPHFRYLVTLIPVCWLFTALLIDDLMRLHWVLGIIVLGLLAYVGTTPEFLYEITHDYNGPVEGTVKYLNQYGKDSDVVAALREEMPLKFYTRMKIYGGLTGEDISGARRPNWVVMRKPAFPPEWELAHLIQQDLLSKDYKIIDLTGYPDISWENRESPGEHLFATAKNAERDVRILQRTTPR